MMQIVILAGGRGSRLGVLTEQVPKPMMNINGIPFLEILIDYLKHQGFKKIILSVGYLSEKIEEHFLDGKHFSVEIKYSKEKKPLGTAGAILNAKSLLEDEFIVINGDTFLALDYLKFINFSKNSSKLCNLVGFREFNNADFKNNLQISNLLVKNYSKIQFDDKLNYVDAGIYFFKKKSLEYFMSDYPISLEIDIFPKLIENHQVGGFITDKKFYDIGTLERIDKFKKFYEHF
jgi:NDP-sugar pyrophosphorylase family protein